MIHIDEDAIFKEVEAQKPKTILLNCPEALLPQTQNIASKLQEKYGAAAFVLTDPCWGICDIADTEAQRLGAELAFNIGHSVSVLKMGSRTFIIDAFDDISFDAVLQETVRVLSPYEVVGLCTSSQHLNQLNAFAERLRASGIDAKVGKGKGLLRDGQVFGCEFYPVFELKDKVNAFAFMGQSRFHSLGVSLSSGKPTFAVDPYFNKVEDVQKLADDLYKKAMLAVYRARDAETFGMIVGLKEGQMLLERSYNLKKRLEELGKKVHLLAQREIKSEYLVGLKGFDAFIQTACPRISLDDHSFSKPILSAPQAEALIKVLKGEDPGDFLIRSHWL